MNQETRRCIFYTNRSIHYLEIGSLLFPADVNFKLNMILKQNHLWNFKDFSEPRDISRFHAVSPFPLAWNALSLNFYLPSFSFFFVKANSYSTSATQQQRNLLGKAFSSFHQQTSCTLLSTSLAVCPCLYYIYYSVLQFICQLISLSCLTELFQGRGCVISDSRTLTQRKHSNVSGMDKLAARSFRRIRRTQREYNLF